MIRVTGRLYPDAVGPPPALVCSERQPCGLQLLVAQHVVGYPLPQGADGHRRVAPNCSGQHGAVGNEKVIVAEHRAILVNYALLGVTAHGATAEVVYERGYPPTINHPAETEIARQAAIRTVGAENVGGAGLPMMASED